MSAKIHIFDRVLLFLITLLLHFKISAQNPCRLGVCVSMNQCRDTFENYRPKLTVCRVVKKEIHVCCAQNRIVSDCKIIYSPEKSIAEIETGMSILNSTVCGKTVSNLISNGGDASITEFPWMALLIYYDGLIETMNCAGTLISDQYVLTAAHCIRRTLVKVRLGEYDTRTNPDCTGRGFSRKCAPFVQDINVEEGIIHQNFSYQSFSNDIGLLRLKQKAVFSETVQPICLPNVCDSTVFSFGRLFISGWGRLESNFITAVLQKAQVALENLRYCQEIYKFKLISITDKHICVGNRNKIETCEGDSGGPLFSFVGHSGDRKYTQYGIASFGFVVCGSEIPSIFTKIASFLPWIVGNIRF